MLDAAAGESDRLLLEEERDFCLRSLRDLDAERDAGDIDAADYLTLRSAYVARAAAAVRALDTASAAGIEDGPLLDARTGDGAGAGGSGQPVAERDAQADGRAAADPGAVSAPGTGQQRSGGAAGRRRGRRRVMLAGLGVVAVAGVASWSVVASSATRLPGQEITGQSLGSETVAQSLQDAQQATEKGDAVTAMKDYTRVLKADPTQVEALTGAGWLLAQTQQPSLLRQGLTMLATAEHADTGYAPAHLYRSLALLSEDDYTDAIPELRWYLAHNPDPQLAGRVRQALQQAEANAAAAKAGK